MSPRIQRAFRRPNACLIAAAFFSFFYQLQVPAFAQEAKKIRMAYSAFSVAFLNVFVARDAELPRNRGGALIVSVERNGPAFNAGLTAGDIIVEVNREPVNNVSQVTKALQSAPPSTPVFLLIWREGQTQFVTMSKR